MRVLLCVGVVMGCLYGVALAKGQPVNNEKGAAVYRTNCVNCHGVNGKGDGPVAPNLIPPPADLTSQVVQQKNDQQLLKSIREGKAGTSMPAWKGDLSAQQIEDVMAFVRTLGNQR